MLCVCMFIVWLKVWLKALGCISILRAFDWTFACVYHDVQPGAGLRQQARVAVQRQRQQHVATHAHDAWIEQIMIKNENSYLTII